MLEWTIRWGVPLVLIATFVVAADPRANGPSAMAQHALDALRDTLLGLIPRLF